MADIGNVSRPPKTSKWRNRHVEAIEGLLDISRLKVSHSIFRSRIQSSGLQYIQRQFSMASTTVPEPTDSERAQLYRYHLANKFLNQRELSIHKLAGILIDKLRR